MSRPPRLSAACSTTVRQPSRLRRSAGIDTISRPVARAMAAAVSFSVDSVRAQMATRTPSSASLRAMALPMPSLAPVTSAVLPRSPRSTAAGLGLPDGPGAPKAHLRPLHLNHLPPPPVLGRAVGAHPQHIAGIECQVLAHPADELAHAEDRVLHGVAEHLLAVEPDRDTQVVRVEAGDDPGSHRLERVGVLAAPEGPVVALPGALADVVAEGGAEDVVERLRLRHLLSALADDRPPLALLVH